MTATTPTLGLITYNPITDGSSLVFNYMNDMSASSTSNMTKIDTAIGNLQSASYITFTSSSTLTNEKVLSAGSGITLENNTSASKLYIHNNIVAGSGIAIINNASASTLTINSNVLANPNVIINGGFTINQRGYTSGTFSASGTYMHDRWVSGSAGGRYTFTQLNSPTTITISSGCSIIQKIEDKNIASSTYTLSWEGTSQARWGINSYTPSGSYVTSPVTITTQTPGSPMSIEFNGGTLGKVKVEEGLYSTQFINRNIAEEDILCQRYCPVFTGAGDRWLGYSFSTTHSYVHLVLKVKPRTPPTGITTTSSDWNIYLPRTNAAGACSNVAFVIAGETMVELDATTSAGAPTIAAGDGVWLYGNTASAKIILTGCEL